RNALAVVRRQRARAVARAAAASGRAEVRLETPLLVLVRRMNDRGRTTAGRSDPKQTQEKTMVIDHDDVGRAEQRRSAHNVPGNGWPRRTDRHLVAAQPLGFRGPRRQPAPTRASI